MIDVFFYLSTETDHSAILGSLDHHIHIIDISGENLIYPVSTSQQLRKGFSWLNSFGSALGPTEKSTQ